MGCAMAANLMTLSREKREIPMKKVLMPVAAFTPILVMVLLMVLLAPATAFSQNNPPPTSPTSPILDLGGAYATPPTTPLALPGGGNGSYKQYTVDFTANPGSGSVTIMFAFRDDVADISLANASVVDLTTPSSNLLTNGNFSSGTVGSTPIGWTYAIGTSTAYGGVVASGSDCYGAGYCWFDGSLDGYDTISQTITTNPGDNYQISFSVAEDSFCGPTCNFSDTSASGIAGIDVAVYAQGGTLAPNQKLTLTPLYSGTGTVTDNQGASGIGTCSEASGVVTQNGTVSATGTCTASYPIGTVVELTANPAAPSTFGAPASGAVAAIPGWGGACTNSAKAPDVCTLTMDSSQAVTAAFVLPGQTVTGTVTTGTTTTYGFAGGNPPTCLTPTAACGYDATGELTSGTSTEMSITSTPFSSQAACDAILQQSFPGAHCFFYYNGLGAGAGDASIGFEVTCPGSATGGTCGSSSSQDFNALIGSDFYFLISENTGLGITGDAPTLTYNGGNAYPGVVKFAGPNPLHPCYLPADTPAPSPSNQISLFKFIDDIPGAQPVKAPSGGTGSCWLFTYAMNDEAPTVS